MLLTLIILVIPLFAEAQDFCARTQRDIKTYLSLPESRITFKNDGGLFDQGVCWWHNRLQRSSAYLVKFEPNMNPPSRPELLKILYSLRVMDQVVVIPGYSDFESFSTDFKNDIQAMLNDWQMLDGFLNFEWLRGISGQSSMNPLAMKVRMLDIYNYYKNSPTPLWVMAQIRGIKSHSFLILNMSGTPLKYKMDVIDSNHPTETHHIDFVEGDRFLRPQEDKYTFVPYSGFQNDFKYIATALKKECGSRLVMEIKEVREGQIEHR